MGGDAPHYVISQVSEADWSKGLPVLDQHDQDPADVKMGELNLMCSVSVNNMLELAVNLCKSGEIEASALLPSIRTA